MKPAIKKGYIFIIFVCLFGMFMSAQARAQSYEALYPCLKELPGWKADQPMNASVTMGKTKMINITRRYQNGDKELVVIFTSGAMAKASWMPYEEGTQINAPGFSISIKNMNGYPVHIVENKEDHATSMSVLIKQGGADEQSAWTIITFSGVNMPKDELVDMAKSFEWSCFNTGVD